MENLKKLELLEGLLDLDRFQHLEFLLYRRISGTYKNNKTHSSSILELRVDVDGRRPQRILSGDLFRRFTIDLGFWHNFNLDAAIAPASHFSPFTIVLYQRSFIVETVDITTSNEVTTLSGAIRYYDDPAVNDETIVVEVPRVRFFQPAPECSAKIYKAGILKSAYCLPKISEYFRSVHLEIDRYEGTSFPEDVDMGLDPSPDDLPAGTIDTARVFRNAGIDLTVQEDDVLNDPDSPDVGNNWSEAELHQLMEDNFDRFGNYLQWNVYGVIVPRFGDPNYNAGYYGTMFDWGGWQAGDTFLRQGFAIAEDATRARSSGSLYNNDAKRDRLVLQTFCHELGHAFNLPHAWQRSVDDNPASNSFMNYPWRYTDGGESGFWEDFRWEFDDSELVWMRHGNRRDVIFGGNDWIGNNLSIFTGPMPEVQEGPLALQIDGNEFVRPFEPVILQVKLTNTSAQNQIALDRLQPEDQLLQIYIEQPDGSHRRYMPPVKRLLAPGDVVNLAPGESIYDSVNLTYSTAGPTFSEPGEYRIRAYYGNEEAAVMSGSLRLRVSSHYSLEEEKLTHFLRRVDVAKFLYYRGGGPKYDGVVQELEEICGKYEKNQPEIVRQLQLALGVHYARDFKTVKVIGKKRLISVVKAEPKKAIKALSGALGSAKGKATTLDALTFAKASGLLLDVCEKLGDWKTAELTAEKAIRQLQDHESTKAHFNSFKKRLTQIRKKTKK